MVDTYGRWTEEQDYRAYPKEEWCDLDYVANYIREQGYSPKIGMEELAERIIGFFLGSDIEGRHYGDDLMIHIPSLAVFISENGGIKEYDYEA